jgi:KUP system potassium uptake protein
MTGKENGLKKLITLAIGSLGIVYGDLGTSPLYTMKVCFNSANGLALNETNILGILSLIFWTLSFVVIFKYISFIMRADNSGEGGMMALISIIQSVNKSANASKTKRYAFLIIMGIFGTALLLSEGTLTPAITVLSAIEGLEVITPDLKNFVVPLTIIILVSLFALQKRGTAGIGSIFGPMMLVWFVMIGGLGLVKIILSPGVLQAVNPFYAVNFFIQNKLAGFLILGSVVLCITGGEALYADMGHFGKKPIRISWLFFVYPCLLLNYFGQGASLLLNPGVAVLNPFYSLSQGWMLYPAIFVSTVASIIASQALISGAFSLTQQAMQLGFLPRLNIIHTSSDIHGQIYIPEINALLMVVCLTLVILFKSSANLASAYGMAVMGTMTITSILFFSVVVRKWGWKPWKAFLLCGLFLMFDLPYLIANLIKFIHGAWIPLFLAATVFSIMLTWKRGHEEIMKFLSGGYVPLDLFLNDLRSPNSMIQRVKGTAVFMTSNIAIVPAVMLHHIKHNKVLHEQIILLSVIIQRVPEIPANKKIEMKILEQGFFGITVNYGYMEKPNIPLILKECTKIEIDGKMLNVDVSQISYYLGRQTLLTTGHSKMMTWQKVLFSFLSKSARPASIFFNIPANRVIELGAQVEI